MSTRSYWKSLFKYDLVKYDINSPYLGLCGGFSLLPGKQFFYFDLEFNSALAINPADYAIFNYNAVFLGIAANINLNQHMRLLPKISAGPQSHVTELGVDTTFAGKLGLAYEVNLFKNYSLNTSLDLLFQSLRSPISFQASLGINSDHNFKLLMPKLRIKIKPNTTLFSPDLENNQNPLIIKIDLRPKKYCKNWTCLIYDPKGNIFQQWQGQKNIPEKILWDGKSPEGEIVQSATDYKIIFTAHDKMDRFYKQEKEITTDVLIFKDGDKLRLRVSAIAFPADSADISRIPQLAIRQKNKKILDRIAEIFKRFPQYKIRIEGHANHLFFDNPVKKKQEQQYTLIPLSQKRAETVRQELIKRGLEAERIKAFGIGGANPVVPFSDKYNNWKNRRVEFILEKK